MFGSIPLTKLTLAILGLHTILAWPNLSSDEHELPPCTIFRVTNCAGGAIIGFTAEEVASLANEWPEDGPPAEGARPTSWFEYRAVINCPGNDPDNPEDVLCAAAVTFCELEVPGSPGPFSVIYRRIGTTSGPVGLWERIGTTCYTPQVPARSGEGVPELTEAMVVEQFHRTQFSLPTASLEPPDNRVLVNLPVYYELVWPEAGFAPQEIDTVDILGYAVRIRPTLGSVTYHFGDGFSEGPTTSLGGSYPNGDVTHEYVQAGDVAPHITVVYGGEYSVNGSDWATIPGTATIEGPSRPLEVLTSTNRLYED